MDCQLKAKVCVRSAALSLICVALILFAGFAQANHVHTDRPDSATHECSVCSVAHAGALINVVYRPVPTIVRSVLIQRCEASPKSLLLTFFLYIRPPPLA
jgi:hypothetical protein